MVFYLVTNSFIASHFWESFNIKFEIMYTFPQTCHAVPEPNFKTVNRYKNSSLYKTEANNVMFFVMVNNIRIVFDTHITQKIYIYAKSNG